MTEPQRTMAAQSGTPDEFGRALQRAMAEGMCTAEQAQTSLDRYRAEFAAAGEGGFALLRQPWGWSIIRDVTSVNIDGTVLRRFEIVPPAAAGMDGAETEYFAVARHAAGLERERIAGADHA